MQFFFLSALEQWYSGLSEVFLQTSAAFSLTFSQVLVPDCFRRNRFSFGGQGADPGHAGGIMSVSCPGNALVFHRTS